MLNIISPIHMTKVLYLHVVMMPERDPVNIKRSSLITVSHWLEMILRSLSNCDLLTVDQWSNSCRILIEVN